MVKIGLTLPSFVEDPEIPLAVARAADRAGIDGVFVYDHLWRGTGPNRRPALECFSLLGAVAAETTRVQVGTLVARATLRPPATLAHCFDSAQRVSGGRLIAGIGSGDSESRAENESFGLEFGTMVQRVNALHDAVRATRGRDYPVWVGGTAMQVCEVVTIADAWNAWGLSSDEFARGVGELRAFAPDAGVTWGGLVLLGAAEADVRAKAAARQVGDHVIAGAPELVADRLRAYCHAGASWLVLGPLDSSDPDNASLIADAIRPLLDEGP